MTALALKRFYTSEQYLKMERAADFRSEFICGEIVAMAGGTRHHTRIISNLFFRISLALDDSPCLTSTSDGQVRTGNETLYTYPDINIVCEEPEYSDDGYDVLLNPIVIVEVLSPSTENFDRILKFQHYKDIPSFREYILVSQKQPKIEQFVKTNEGEWEHHITEGIDSTLILFTVAVSIPFTDIYKRVDFS